MYMCVCVWGVCGGSGVCVFGVCVCVWCVWCMCVWCVGRGSVCIVCVCVLRLISVLIASHLKCECGCVGPPDIITSIIKPFLPVGIPCLQYMAGVKSICLLEQFSHIVNQTFSTSVWIISNGKPYSLSFARSSGEIY